MEAVEAVGAVGAAGAVEGFADDDAGGEDGCKKVEERDQYMLSKDAFDTDDDDDDDDDDGMEESCGLTTPRAVQIGGGK